MSVILTDIKRLLGIEPEYTAFDYDIKIHINSAFCILNQLGVGTSEPFMIESGKEEWTAFINKKNIESVKSYIYIFVRKLFDPPNTSYVLESYDKILKEIEWRLKVASEGGVDSG